ncbi:zinc-dependent alcohol dehydrogenase [Roseobacteraceae bacterium S113]
MRALVYEGPNTLAMRDVPRPVAGPGEHVVRVEAVGICGSDMHGYLGHDPRRVPPLVLGHEAAGVIEGGPRDGTRVTINPLRPCGACAACDRGDVHICANRKLMSIPPVDGAFSQYIAVPEANMVDVPAEVPLAKAALVEPLAVGWHAAKLGLRVVHPELAHHALVLGGGAIGLATTLCLRALGVDEITIVETNETRADFLRAHCGETVVAKAEGEFGLILDAVGIPATREIACARALPGGVIVHIGLGHGEGGVDTRKMTLQEIALLGSYCYTPQDFRDTAEALYAGRLGPLDWIAEMPLDAGVQAFPDLLGGTIANPKVVLSPWP